MNRATIFARSLLAGLAALIMAVLVLFLLAVCVPRILELIPLDEGGLGVFMVGPFPIWPLAIVAVLIFCSGFYWSLRRAHRHR